MVNGATVTFTGVLNAADGIFGNVRIANGSDNNEIDTSTGNLILDSASGTTQINDNLSVTGTGTFTGDVIAFSSSDKNLKENIVPITNALDKVGIMTGYTFTWKDHPVNQPYNLNTGNADIGVIAQEVEALGLPGITTTREDTGYKAVRYERLVPILIEAIKELKSEIEDLKK